jgi:hypothetical protein
MKILTGIAAGIIAAIVAAWFLVARREQKLTDPTEYNKQKD